MTARKGMRPRRNENANLKAREGRKSEKPKAVERLNRFLSRAGVASRRKADELISGGVVKVNGEVVTEMGTRVAEDDVVEVNGRRVTPLGHHYILLNKPAGVVTTTSDERGRETVLDKIDLPEARKNIIYPVGRLDRETTGVLLLTNDGELAHRLMHPSFEVDKLYSVQTERPLSDDELERLRTGVELDDGPARADEVAFIPPEGRSHIGLRIHEGRNRQVRRMIEAIGHRVIKLERVNYAGLTVTGLRRGKWRRLKDHEIRRLRRLVKLK